MNHGRGRVDRHARARAAQILRDFVSGKISNDQFAGECPRTDDLAVHAIWNTAWLFYDDFKEHKLTGRYRLPPDQKRACVRWILFLHSDLPYEWPDLTLPGADPAARVERSVFRRLFSMSNPIDEEQATRFLSAGHYPVWPFLRVADYKRTLSSPRLLAQSGQKIE